MLRLQVGVACFLIALWAVGVAFSYFNSAFKQPGGVVPMALIAAGFLLGKSAVDIVVRRNGNGNA